MAIKVESNIIKGAKLEYIRVGSLSANKTCADVRIEMCVNASEDPLHSHQLHMSDDQKKELSDYLIKSTYNKIKEMELISGEDC